MSTSMASDFPAGRSWTMLLRAALSASALMTWPAASSCRPLSASAASRASGQANAWNAASRVNMWAFAESEMPARVHSILTGVPAAGERAASTASRSSLLAFSTNAVVFARKRGGLLIRHRRACSTEDVEAASSALSVSSARCYRKRASARAASRL